MQYPILSLKMTWTKYYYCSYSTKKKPDAYAAYARSSSSQGTDFGAKPSYFFALELRLFKHF